MDHEIDYEREPDITAPLEGGSDDWDDDTVSGGAPNLQLIKQAATKFANTAVNVVKNADVYAARANDAINRGAQMVNTASQQATQAYTNVSTAATNVANNAQQQYNQAAQAVQQVQQAPYGQQVQQAPYGQQVQAPQAQYQPPTVQELQTQYQNGQVMTGQGEIGGGWDRWDSLNSRYKMLLIAAIIVSVVLLIMLIVHLMRKKSKYADDGLRQCIADAGKRSRSGMCGGENMLKV